jgi:Trk K+ transport system NAD-binding subunit
MDMYEALSSPSCLLNEQVARQIFDILPEQGPVMVIVDRDGHFWPSDSEKFSKLSISEPFLKELQAKVDDGAEPVVTQVDECSIIAAQMATERTNCGYVIVALPQYSPESTLINIDLIEILLNQISLIAKLIEKNNLLYELQMNQFSVYGQSNIASN